MRSRWNGRKRAGLGKEITGRNRRTGVKRYGRTIFPRTVWTDHRIGFTLHKLEQVLEGDIDENHRCPHHYYQAKKLKEL